MTPATFPGQPAQAATDNTMTGALTSKTLTEQASGRAAENQAAAAGRRHHVHLRRGRAGATATTADGRSHQLHLHPGRADRHRHQPSGTVTTYTYDPKTGRLDRGGRAGPRRDARRQTGYTYDPATGRVKSVYDPAHPADAISYDYDADGHVIAMHYPDGTSTKASYDDNGRLATTTDITGAVTTYTYNADGTCGPAATDLCQAVQNRGGVTLASVAYTYDPMDRVHTITRGNGVTTTIGLHRRQPGQDRDHHRRRRHLAAHRRLHLRQPRQRRHPHHHQRPARSGRGPARPADWPRPPSTPARPPRPPTATTPTTG